MKNKYIMQVYISVSVSSLCPLCVSVSLSLCLSLCVSLSLSLCYIFIHVSVCVYSLHIRHVMTRTCVNIHNQHIYLHIKPEAYLGPLQHLSSLCH